MKNEAKTKYSNEPIPLPSVEELNKIISYNPLTGIFRWKVPPEEFAIGDIVGELSQSGYVRAYLCGKLRSMHRIAYKMYHGVDPEIVHHINHIRDDNRIENLQSMENYRHHAFRRIGYTHKLTNGKTSKKIYGVSYNRKRKRWVARIMFAGKRKTLGNFSCKALAGITYMLAKDHIKAHGAI